MKTELVSTFNNKIVTGLLIFFDFLSIRKIDLFIFGFGGATIGILFANGIFKSNLLLIWMAIGGLIFLSVFIVFKSLFFSYYEKNTVHLSPKTILLWKEQNGHIHSFSPTYLSTFWKPKKTLFMYQSSKTLIFELRVKFNNKVYDFSVIAKIKENDDAYAFIMENNEKLDNNSLQKMINSQYFEKMDDEHILNFISSVLNPLYFDVNITWI